MNQVLEERLYAELDRIQVPADELELARQRGLAKAKKQHTRRQMSWVYRLGIVMTIVAFFLVSIRISPVFASTVAKIPGFSVIVDMITYDKGLEDIVENDYYEPFNIRVTENDLTFTLEGIIADETGMIIFYKLEAPYDISSFGRLGNARVLQGGKELEAGYGMGGATLEETTIVQSKIDISSPNGIDYSDPNFELVIQFHDLADTKFTIPFTFQKPIAASKRYELNQELMIDGQLLTVEYVTISPLRAEVAIAVNESNDMQLLNFDDLRLIDENGEEWGNIRNGTSAWGDIREGKIRKYIQSNYFREPEQLTLQIGGVQALPKGEDYIKVDFEQKEVIYQPKLIPMEVTFVNDHGLQIEYLETRESFTASLLSSSGIDANGEAINLRSSSRTHGTGELSKQMMYFDTTTVVNPVKFYIWNYPNYLSGTAEVKLPLE